MNLIARSIAQIGVGYNQQHVARIGLFGQEENSGRSGYWRLFFYQLQEEALKKGEENVGEEELIELKDGSVKVKARRKSRPKRALEVTEEIPLTETPRKIPLAPVTTEPSTPWIIQAWQITTELRELIGQSRLVRVKYETRSDPEDEEDLILLLLAA